MQLRDDLLDSVREERTQPCPGPTQSDINGLIASRKGERLKFTREDAAGCLLKTGGCCIQVPT